MDDFIGLMERMVDKDFVVRDLPVFYNLSMRTQVNEIDNDKHMMMYFIEFLEAFSRIVDELSPAPEDDKVSNNYNFIFIKKKSKIFL